MSRIGPFLRLQRRSLPLWLMICICVCLLLALWVSLLSVRTYACQTQVSAAAGTGPTGAPKGTLGPAPDIQFLDEHGRLTSLTAYRGQTVLLVFWASWCPHCVRGLSSLVALEKRLSDAGIPARVLFINVDSDSSGKEFIKKRNLPIAPFWDPSSDGLHAFKSFWLPTTVLVDAGGQVVSVVHGERQWDSQDMLDTVERVARR